MTMNILKRLRERLFANTEGIKFNLDDAAKYENTHEYEHACYSYACAIVQGAQDQRYKERIQHLYKVHGPFTFKRQLEKMKKEYCSNCESCGEGYHAGVVKIIEDIIKES